MRESFSGVSGLIAGALAPRRGSLLGRYGVAVVAVAAAVVLKLLLSPFIEQETPFLLVLIAVTVGAWYGGLGPGLLATALSAPLVDYLFLEPAGSFSGLSPESTPLVLFALEGGAVSLLVAALHSARDRATESTRRARSQESELRHSEERFRLLVEGVKDYGIFMLDPEGRVASWNEGAERMKGYMAGEVIGRHFSLFYPEEEVRLGRPEQKLEAAAAEGRAVDEGWRVRKDGSRFRASVVVTALRDKEGDLRGFSKITRDITEQRRSEERLRRSLDSLLTLHEAGQLLASSLDREEIAASLLRIVRRTPAVEAASVALEDGQEWLSPLYSEGPRELLQQARHLPAVEAARREALRKGSYRVLRPLADGDEGPTRLFAAAVFLPLRSQKKGAGGLLEVYGTEAVAEEGTPETLASLANQAASALENARLYGDLAEREERLQELIGQLIAAQEEERRRVAYEVHDGLTQMAVAAYQYLQDFAEEHPPASERERRELEETVELVRQTVGESRRVIADLRPTVLDDLGLAAAARQQVEGLRAEGYRVDYREELGDERPPAALETTLFRILQEALSNVRKHARTSEVEVTLERLDNCIRLTVRDRGCGFELRGAEPDGGPGERIGLSSMRERAALLGGELRIESEAGSGTSVLAEVPLSSEAARG